MLYQNQKSGYGIVPHNITDMMGIDIKRDTISQKFKGDFFFFFEESTYEKLLLFLSDTKYLKFSFNFDFKAKCQFVSKCLFFMVMYFIEAYNRKAA